MANLTVIYDSNVLYPAPLRDLLMRLALTDLFRARWTEDIHEEWMRNVLAARPDLTRAQLERTRALMDAHVRDGVVEGYRSLIPSLELPDPDDRHVLAAAIRAHATIIVTFNLKDFPPEQLAPYGAPVGRAAAAGLRAAGFIGLYGIAHRGHSQTRRRGRAWRRRTDPRDDRIGTIKTVYYAPCIMVDGFGSLRDR